MSRYNPNIVLLPSNLSNQLNMLLNQATDETLKVVVNNFIDKLVVSEVMINEVVVAWNNLSTLQIMDEEGFTDYVKDYGFNMLFYARVTQTDVDYLDRINN